MSEVLAVMENEKEPKRNRGRSRSPEIQARNAAIIRLYHTGKSPEELAGDYQITKFSVYGILRDAGISLREDGRAIVTRSSKEDRNKEIIEAWRSGASQADIARSYNISRQRVHEIIALHVQELRVKYAPKEEEDGDKCA